MNTAAEQTIDVFHAMETLIDTVTALTRAAQSGRSLIDTALSAITAAGGREWTLGAVAVWRAADRAERAGDSWLSAAEAGLRAGIRYLDLLPMPFVSDAGTERIARYTALLRLELQARSAMRADLVAHPRPLRAR